MRKASCRLAIGLVIALSGCGEPELKTAGGKPVAYWVESLQSHDAKVRKKAARELGNVGMSDAKAVPALIGAMKDRDAAVRTEVVLSLLRIGPAAKEAVPALTEAQSDRDARVRTYAVQALARLQGEK